MLFGSEEDMVMGNKEGAKLLLLLRVDFIWLQKQLSSFRKSTQTPKF